MVTVDAKGLFCPEPLMMTQDALKKNPGEQVVVEVDSATPRDNILRLARRKKLNATVDEKDGVHHYYRLTFRSFVCPDQRLVSEESLVGAILCK